MGDGSDERPAPARDDAQEVARLREEVQESRHEIAHLRQEAASASDERRTQRALLERLREQAGIDREALASVRRELDAAESELVDLRAVRDALTPPTLPQRPGLTLAVSFLPATQGVGGDFYLAAAGPDDSTVIVVGDVAGKGVRAARTAAFVRTTFATTARFSDDPCRLLEWANVALTERAGFDQRFVTAACMTFAPGTRVMRWALAGHPPPLWLRTGEELASGTIGPPLGIRDLLECSAASATLDPGEAVLLYTDGLVESRRDGELYGLARAASLLREMAGEPSHDVLARLRSDATEFAGHELADDLCLLAATTG